MLLALKNDSQLSTTWLAKSSISISLPEVRAIRTVCPLIGIVASHVIVVMSHVSSELLIDVTGSIISLGEVNSLCLLPLHKSAHRRSIELSFICFSTPDNPSFFSQSLIW